MTRFRLQLSGRKGADVRSNAGGVSPSGADFQPGHRPLFSYKRYADQEPLELSLPETATVVALVLGPAAVGGLLGHEYDVVLNADAAAAAAGMLPGGKGLEVRIAAAAKEACACCML